MNNYVKTWVVTIVAAATLHGVSAKGQETTSPSNLTRSQPTLSIGNQGSKVQGIDDTQRVAGQFIVVMRKSSLNDYAQRTSSSIQSDVLAFAGQDLSASYGGSVSRVYGAALDGFVLSGLSDAQARKLALDPRIELVEADRNASLFQYQTSPRWGLDRIDQRNLPFSNGFSYPNTGAGINVYVIDSGVYANSDFGGRVNSSGGYTAVNDGYGTSDCNGHGTHVAGIVGS